MKLPLTHAMRIALIDLKTWRGGIRFFKGHGVYHAYVGRPLHSPSTMHALHKRGLVRFQDRWDRLFRHKRLALLTPRGRRSARTLPRTFTHG